MKRYISVIALVLLCVAGIAQEINSKVTINTPKLQTADPKVFETLETAIQEFLNNTRWTNDIYEPHERLELTININVRDEISPTAFTANFYIQATRPIYGSNHSTAILTHNDKDFAFVYEEFQPLTFTDNIFNSNLTSFLAFYAYVALGMDYDSFEFQGGNPHFQKAQDIINSIPPSLTGTFINGWRSIDGNRNRYWIVESILSPRAIAFREANYQYHRLGLDTMHEDPDQGRKIVHEALMKIKGVNDDYPNAMVTQMFVTAKSDEIVDVFLKGNSQEKRDVYGLMVRIDAANASKYRDIRR